MTYDFKKDQKQFYAPKVTPEIIDIPEMKFVAVRGEGNPNDPDGVFQEAIGILYGISYTIKMSKKTTYEIKDYVDYVIPPLEGFWWKKESTSVPFSKENFYWTVLLRLPTFVTKEVFEWAKEQASIKKKIDTSKAEYYTYHEGLSVQCLHLGTYDDEPETLSKMESMIHEQGYEFDLTQVRYHHEIYLSNALRTPVEKQRTILRYPIRKVI